MTDPAPSRSSFSLRSVASVAIAAGGQLILLLVLQIVQARLFGASAIMDAYLCAYAIPLVVGAVLAGAAGTAVVPFYNERRESVGEPTASSAAAQIAWLLAGASLAVAVILFVAAETIIRGLYRDLSQETVQVATRLLRILCWLVPLTTLTGYFYGLLHARGRFVWPAMTGLLGPAVTAAILVTSNFASLDRLAWAVLTGAVLGVATLLAAVPDQFRFLSGVPTHSLRRFLPYGIPVLIALTYSRFDLIVDRWLGSRLSTGSISQMGYASRIIAAVASLATSGLSVVIFPSLARHAAAGDGEQLRRDLSEGWRWLAVSLIPVVAGLAVCSDLIIRTLLQRGAFSPHDTAAVSHLIRLSIGFLIAAAIAEVGTRAITALNRLWIATAIGMASLTFASVAKFLLVDRYGASGLVATTSVAAIVTAAAILLTLRSLGVRGYILGLGPAVLRASVCSLASVGVGRMVMSMGGGWFVLTGVVVAVVLYCMLMLLSQDEFALRAWAAVRGHGSEHPQP